MSGDVVATARDAERAGREPLIVLDALEAFLDAVSLGDGAVSATPLGEGHSNVTYLLRRGEQRFVLRRAPRGPLPPSAHDVLREARLIGALAGAGVRVPELLAVCADATVIGAPFFLTRFIDGHVVTDALPAAFAQAGAGAAIADELVDALVELHAVDAAGAALAELGRPHGYLPRQLRRFAGLLAAGATRPLPELDELTRWLGETLPPEQPPTVVHGDYRLGNVMLSADPIRVVALLDWELGTLGDPLADLGYLTATWAERGETPDPMLALSAATRGAGFPSRAALAERYAQRTGRSLRHLRWYQVLALWKAAIFLERSYRRYLDGTTDDAYFARLADGVPVLARRALALARSWG